MSLSFLLILILGMAACQSDETGGPQSQRVASGFATTASTPSSISVSTNTLPFNVKVEEVSIDGAIGAHSYVSAVGSGGQWLMLGGRLNGLHLASQEADTSITSSTEGFPTSTNNTSLLVVDFAAETPFCTYPVRSAFNSDVVDQLSSTNMLATAVDGTLWIAGGYGDDSTFDRLIAVDVDDAITQVSAACAGEEPDFSATINYSDSYADVVGSDAVGVDYLKVTGGGMEAIDDALFLVLGQQYTGNYNNFGDCTSDPPVINNEQYYTCEVISFPAPDPAFGSGNLIDLGDTTMTVVGDGTTLPASEDANAAQCQAETTCGNGDGYNPYGRRDLNVVPAVYVDGGSTNTAINVFGGVFNGGVAFMQPMYIDADDVTLDSTVTLDPTTGEECALGDDNDCQVLSQYDTASLVLFDSDAGTVHSLLLGGISNNYCSDAQTGETNNQCAELTQCSYTSGGSTTVAPGFITDGTMISCSPDVSNGAYDCSTDFQQYYLSEVFGDQDDATFVTTGGNAKFFLDPDIKAYDNGVIKLDKLTAGEWTEVGYIYGGIAVDTTYMTSGCGNPMITATDQASATQASNLASKISIKPLAQ